jgi:hypothetical protein
MIARNHVVQHGETEALLGFEQPVQITAPSGLTLASWLRALLPTAYCLVIKRLERSAAVERFERLELSETVERYLLRIVEHTKTKPFFTSKTHCR